MIDPYIGISEMVILILDIRTHSCDPGRCSFLHLPRYYKRP